MGKKGVDYGMQRMGMKGSDYANNLPVLPPYVPSLGTTDKCSILSSQTKLILF